MDQKHEWTNIGEDSTISFEQQVINHAMEHVHHYIQGTLLSVLGYFGYKEEGCLRAARLYSLLEGDASIKLKMLAIHAFLNPDIKNRGTDLATGLKNGLREHYTDIYLKVHTYAGSKYHLDPIEQQIINHLNDPKTHSLPALPNIHGQDIQTSPR